jgi:hypothetical protein
MRYIRAQQRNMCSINLALLFSVGGGLTRLSSRPGLPAVEMYVRCIGVAGNAVCGRRRNKQPNVENRKEREKSNGSGRSRKAKWISLLCKCERFLGGVWVVSLTRLPFAVYCGWVSNIILQAAVLVK